MLTTDKQIFSTDHPGEWERKIYPERALEVLETIKRLAEEGIFLNGTWADHLHHLAHPFRGENTSLSFIDRISISLYMKKIPDQKDMKDAVRFFEDQR